MKWQSVCGGARSAGCVRALLVGCIALWGGAARGQDSCDISPDRTRCLGDCSTPGDVCHPREILADAFGNFLAVTCCSCDPVGCELQVNPATLQFFCNPNPGCGGTSGEQCRLVGHGNTDGTISYSCDCVNPEEPSSCTYVEECNPNCGGMCVKRCSGVCEDPAEACLPKVIAETFPGARDFHTLECDCNPVTTDICRPVAKADGVYCQGACPDPAQECQLMVTTGADGVSQEYRCDPCAPNTDTGACCYVTDVGSTGCFEATQFDCLLNPSHTYLGDGTNCIDHGFLCEEGGMTGGACCYTDPPTGIPLCAQVQQPQCINVLNGIYLGNNTVCDPDPCPVSEFGACCWVDGAGNPQCAEVTPLECETELMGIYQGNGTDCDSDLCPIEQSCQCPGNCEDRTPAYADQAYATFTDEVAVATESAQIGTDPVVVNIDIKNRGLAPINANWTVRTNSRYSHPTWTRNNLGSVFGVALDRRGHTYVTASTSYYFDAVGTIAGATSGSVFRINAASGAVAVFANLPNTGPGLGNICYHGPDDQFFASNFEDGRIYRLSATGACLGTFDHATGTIAASCAAEGGDAPGFAPLHERVWGLQAYNGRLYYGVWSEDIGRPSLPLSNSIWSIALVGGNFSGAPVLEFYLPPMAGSGSGGGNGIPTPFASPPADIAFSESGCMLVAERGMYDDSNPAPHYARVLEYRQFSGSWWPSSFNFAIGVINSGTNAAGGVDYDRAGNVWATGDALQFYPQTVYGLQSLPCTGGDVTNSVLVDLNGVYTTSDKTEIGDVEVGCSEHCIAPPKRMAAWFPLDEPQTAVKAEEIVWDRDGVFNGTTSVVGMVSAARRFTGNGDHIRVPNAAQHNFGTGDFSIDAWVRSIATSGLHVMLDKRVNPVRGFSFFLGTGQLGFQLGDGAGFTNYARPGLVADGQWHHIAVTVDRDQPTGLVMYVDGVGVAFDPTARPGSVSTTSDLWIGCREPAFGQIFFAGELDEIELFPRVLTAAEVQGLYNAGKQGKCKDRCHLPWDAQLCKNRNTVTVSMTICNDSPVAHNYVYSFAGNNNCSWPGPTVFSPPAGSVTIPGNTCVNIPVTITRPVGMTAGFVACYNVNISNLDTGHVFGCEGSIWARDTWCIRVIDVTATPIDINIGLPTGVRFEVANDGDVAAPFEYRFEVMPSEMDPNGTGDPGEMGLNGLPPGEPVLGSIFVPAGGVAEIAVDVTTDTHEPFRFYDLLVITASGGQGAPVPAASAALRSAVPCGDFNRDGLIGDGDVGLFDQCVGGPDAAISGACPVTVDADCDEDDDVDLRDFAIIQKVFGAVTYTP